MVFWDLKDSETLKFKTAAKRPVRLTTEQVLAACLASDKEDDDFFDDKTSDESSIEDFANEDGEKLDFPAETVVDICFVPDPCSRDSILLGNVSNHSDCFLLAMISLGNHSPFDELWWKTETLFFYQVDIDGDSDNDSDDVSSDVDWVPPDDSDNDDDGDDTVASTSVSDPDKPGPSTQICNRLQRTAPTCKAAPRKTSPRKTAPRKSVSRKTTARQTAAELQARWKKVDKTYQNPNSNADFVEFTGLKRPASNAETPLECFLLLFTPELIDQVVTETNRYYQQEQLKKASPMPWKDTKAEEIKAFFGIVLAMGLIKLPEVLFQRFSHKKQVEKVISDYF